MIKDIFATPIAFCKWTHDPSVIERLRDVCMRAGEDGKTRYFEFTDFPGEDAALFRKWILEKSRQYAIDIGRSSGYVVLQDAWVRVIRNPVNTVPMHHHSEAWCVGTFYFTSGGGDIMLADPRGYIGEFERGRVLDAENRPHGICNDFYYTPEENTAIIFPGYLRHMVHSSKDSNPRTRIALSWNVRFTDNDNFIHTFQLDSSRYMRL